MSNETKREVLVNAVDALADAQASSDNNVGLGHQDADLFMAEYDAALPDDLPTIPEVVDKFIRGWGYATLVMIFSQAKYLSAFAPTEREQHGWQWIVDNEDEFARAWIYGVWRVEETGEIVKLEAEK